MVTWKFRRCAPIFGLERVWQSQVRVTGRWTRQRVTYSLLSVAAPLQGLQSGENDGTLTVSSPASSETLAALAALAALVALAALAASSPSASFSLSSENTQVEEQMLPGTFSSYV